MVQRVWQCHEIQPHRMEKFKLSNDLTFEEKGPRYCGPLSQSSISNIGCERKELNPSTQSYRSDSYAFDYYS